MTLAFEEPQVEMEEAQPIVDALLSLVAAIQSRPVDSVIVPAPLVNVRPQVNVESDFSELTAEIQGLRADVGNLVLALGRPTVRTVERDDEGRITKITETR